MYYISCPCSSPSFCLGLPCPHSSTPSFTPCPHPYTTVLTLSSLPQRASLGSSSTKYDRSRALNACVNSLFAQLCPPVILSNPRAEESLLYTLSAPEERPVYLFCELNHRPPCWEVHQFWSLIGASLAQGRPCTRPPLKSEALRAMWPI